MRIDIKETKDKELAIRCGCETPDLHDAEPEACPNPRIDELEHVRQTMIAMYEAQLETLKRFGFKNWTAFKTAQDKVMGAVEKPIVVDGYSLYRKDTPIIAKAGGKQMGIRSKLQITKV